MVQHLIPIQADGEAEVLVCIREAVDNVPESFLRVGKKSAVLSKQQLGDEFLRSQWFSCVQEDAED